MHYKIIIGIVLVFYHIIGLSQHDQTVALIVNPYRNVDWKSVHKYKANFHTHTKQSDGAIAPHDVISAYHKAGYKILAITDHNRITWDWKSLRLLNSDYENCDPDSLGMLAVKGNELSGAHHIGNYFNVLPGKGSNTMRAFDQITAMDGLAMFNHPGRYWKLKTVYKTGSPFSPDWYQRFFERYPALIGLEVFNMADSRYPNDRILWDELLTRMMPDRPIWGFSNDDMHHAPHMFHGYQYMLMPDLTEDNLKKAMKEGASYFINEPKGNGASLVPVLDSIVVDDKNQSIKLYAKNYSTIEWISGIDGSDSSRISRVVAAGSVLSYKSFVYNYVRAVITNEHGKTCTQPFGFNVYKAPFDEKPLVNDQKRKVKKLKFDWVKIPAGSFMMGSPDEENNRENDELQRMITIDAFSMSKYEVTFEQYDIFCDATGRAKPDDEGWGRGKRPVINVSWEDASAFASWVGCRLPTEAEWEYACRAQRVTPYNTGNCLGAGNANYNAEFSYASCEKGSSKQQTLPVGSFSPNPWGLYDMHGNVFEWCSDWSGEYNTGEQLNPKGPAEGSGKIYRGGSWSDYEQSCRSAYRCYVFKSTRSNNIGFRLCK